MANSGIGPTLAHLLAKPPQLPLAFAPSSAVFGYGRGDATVVLARTP